MKKALMGMVFIFGLQGVQPLHAMSMPSAGYEVVKQRLEAAKDRVVQALSTNKRESIIAAVAALLVALSLFTVAKKKGGHTPLKLDSKEEHLSSGKQSTVGDPQLLRAGVISRKNGRTSSYSTPLPSSEVNPNPALPSRYSGYYYYPRH